MEPLTGNKTTSLKTLLFVGVVIFTILGIISIVSMIFLSKIGFIIITLISFIILLIFAIKRFGKSIAFGVGLALFSSIVLGMGVGDVCRTIIYKSVHNISVSEAIEYPDASIFSFKDGFVKKEFLGVKDEYIKTKKSIIKIYSCYVAPVVPLNWKKEDPIPLWVGLYRDKEKGTWDNDYRRGFRISKYKNYFMMAILDAEKKHGIKSLKNAPLIIWTNNPSNELNTKIIISSLISGFFILVWLIGLPILKYKNKI